MLTSNVPTSPIIAPADPNVEGLGSGMNAASNSAGIGIAASATVNPKADDWSRDGRTSVPGQPIGWGGDSVETGQEDADIPDLLAVDYETPDFNDTVGFFQANQVAVDKGDVFDTANGAILLSTPSAQVEIGDWVWGAIPVA